MKNEKQICQYCRWWKCHDYYGGVDLEEMTSFAGECRKDSPQALPRYGSFTGAGWPETLNVDWCGKFTDRRDDIRPWRHISDIVPDCLEKTND